MKLAASLGSKDWPNTSMGLETRIFQFRDDTLYHCATLSKSIPQSIASMDTSTIVSIDIQM